MAALMRTPALDYRNGMVAVTWSAECSQTGSETEEVAAVQHGLSFVKEKFKMILLDGCHRHSALRLLKVEGGKELTERSMCVFQVVCRDGQVVGQAEAIKSSEMANNSTANARMDSLFLSPMKTALNYARAFEL